jgi:hypothetical protein
MGRTAPLVVTMLGGPVVMLAWGSWRQSWRRRSVRLGGDRPRLKDDDDHHDEEDEHCEDEHADEQAQVMYCQRPISFVLLHRGSQTRGAGGSVVG